MVVEALEPPELFEWFADLRRAFGMNIIPLDADAGTAVVRALRDNHVVCLLCDRDIGGGGVEVEFFGERTLLPGGPATLALRTGAPVLPSRGLLPPARPCSGWSAHRSRRSATVGCATTCTRVTQSLATRARGADPRRAGAVAPPAAELAERSRVGRAAQLGVSPAREVPFRPCG